MTAAGKSVSMGSYLREDLSGSIGHRWATFRQIFGTAHIHVIPRWFGNVSDPKEKGALGQLWMK
ncbi:MAG: hypothetical protein QG577_753 [Thermodesulfobacteriota bacterium]|nr:hypothetical protein [Thermodesulfobacteriota bacterium]